MKNSLICWIDDSPKLMQNVAKSTFMKLWEEEIDSAIVFFGDNYKDTEREPDFKKNYFERFKDILFDISSDFQKQDNIDLFIPDYRKVKPIVMTEYEELANSWKRITEKDDINDSKFQVNNLVKRITDAFENVSCYGLDLTLLYNDVKRVKMNIPIISMSIYHTLKQQEKPCFLYSTYTYDHDFYKYWEVIYKQKYPKDSMRDFIFFNRKLMLEDGSNYKTEKIISIIKPSIKGGK